MLTRLIERFLPKHSFLHRVILLATGTAMGQLIILLCAPILTRLYSPAEFGVFTVFAAIIGILGGVACLRFELAVPMCRNDEDAAATFQLANITGLATTIFTALAVWFFGDGFADLLNLPGIEPWLWLVPVTLLAVSMQTAANHWAIYRGQFKLMAQSQLALALGRISPQILLGFAGAGVFGLLVGQASGFFLSALFFWIGWRFASSAHTDAADAARGDAKAASRPMPFMTRFADIRRMAIQHHRFAAFTSPSTLMNGVTRLTPAMFLASLYGAEIAGWYGFAQLAIGAPIQLLAMSVGQVYLSEAPKLRGRDDGAMEQLFLGTTKKLLLVGLLCLGCMAIPGPWLFGFVFGDEWQTSGVMIQILAALYLARFVVVPVSQTLNMFDRQDLVLLWDSLNLVILLACFATASWFSLDAMATIALYSAAMTVSYGIHYLMAWRITVRNAGLLSANVR